METGNKILGHWGLDRLKLSPKTLETLNF